MELKLTFDTPHNGWLPCELKFGDQVIEYDASDVPINPTGELVESLWKAVRGESSEVWWHLEPAGYYFIFEPKGKELIFKLQYSNDSTIANRQTIFEGSLSLKDSLMMFWRNVKRTGSFPVSDTEWPGIDEQDLQKLKLKIGELKHSG